MARDLASGRREVRRTPAGRCGALLALLCSPLVSYAHHSYVEYDQQRTIEIEGTLTKVAWQNPHASIKVAGKDASGKPITWTIESESLAALRRRHAPIESFRFGDRVKIAGWPSRRAADRLFATNLLAKDGVELVTWRYAKPRWTSGPGRSETAVAQTSVRPAALPANGPTLFQVWSHPPPSEEREAARKNRVFPLTAAARKKVASRDPHANVEAVGCRPKGMPLIMFNPFPIEFVDKGKQILLRIELYDLVRTIHMQDVLNPEQQPLSLLGYSTGRWEGKTLVVQTSRIDYAYLEFGVPQSTSSRLVERFTPDAEGRRLDYIVTATDPEMLTEPAAFKAIWVWRPGESVMPYNCVEN